MIHSCLVCVKESCVTKWRVKDCIWQKVVRDKVVCGKIVCDKVVVWQIVCERCCVIKWCVKDGVWQSGVWHSCVWKMVCDKVVCERWCVTKLCQRGGGGGGTEAGRRRDGGGTGTESKTRTPHKDVGNQVIKTVLVVATCCHTCTYHEIHCADVRSIDGRIVSIYDDLWLQASGKTQAAPVQCCMLQALWWTLHHPTFGPPSNGLWNCNLWCLRPEVVSGDRSCSCHCNMQICGTVAGARSCGTGLGWRRSCQWSLAKCLTWIQKNLAQWGRQTNKTCREILPVCVDDLRNHTYVHTKMRKID